MKKTLLAIAMVAFAAWPLASVLASLHRTGREELSFVRFVDGGDHPNCSTSGSLMAFTEPGSHVIRICGPRFSVSAMRDPALGDIMIIHELLHALGLGENPPASSDVTNQVRLKCGGSEGSLLREAQRAYFSENTK